MCLFIHPRTYKICSSLFSTMTRLSWESTTWDSLPSIPPTETTNGENISVCPLTALYLELLWRGVGFSSFWRKDEAKRFRKSSSPLPRTSLLCPRLRVEEISTLIGSHVPIRLNYPGDIFPQFCWSCWYYSPTSAYALSTNRVWNCRHQYYPQDNVRPYTP